MNVIARNFEEVDIVPPTRKPTMKVVELLESSPTFNPMTRTSGHGRWVGMTTQARRLRARWRAERIARDHHRTFFRPLTYLRKKSQPVDMERFSADEVYRANVVELADCMKKAMVDHKGIGIQASQLGVYQCVIVMRVKTKKAEGLEPARFYFPFTVMINPRIVWASGIQSVYEERCVNIIAHKRVDGKKNILQQVWVPRSEFVLVEYYTLTGQKCLRLLIGWHAKVFLHEYDHMLGVLITDYAERGVAQEDVKRLTDAYLEGRLMDALLSAEIRAGPVLMDEATLQTKREIDAKKHDLQLFAAGTYMDSITDSDTIM